MDPAKQRGAEPALRRLYRPVSDTSDIRLGKQLDPLLSFTAFLTCLCMDLYIIVKFKTSGQQCCLQRFLVRGAVKVGTFQMQPAVERNPTCEGFYDLLIRYLLTVHA